MKECPYNCRCTIFEDKMSHMPEMVALMQRVYCRNNFRECARYIIFNKLSTNYVPSDLFPHEYTRATEILKSYK